MKPMEADKTQVGTRSAARGGKRQAGSSEDKPRSLDTSSRYALIEALRGSCKGKGSLVKARERDHKREDRLRTKKLMARA